MKAAVLSLEGKKESEIELPEQFSGEVDLELIKRAVLAIHSAGIQAKAPSEIAGRDNTSIYVGSRSKPTQHRSINIEKARKPRLKNRRGLIAGRVAGIPGVVGGTRAHPPKIDKVWEEKINRKEKKQARDSAIAATASTQLVKARGHLLPSTLTLPLIIDSKFEELDRTKKVVEVLEKIGIYADIERVKSKKKIRAGKGKRRGRKHKIGKSILIVADKNEKIFRAARNLQGVEISKVNNLNADILAPGALPGRLTLWTEGAVKALSKGIEKNEKKETVKAKAK